MDKELKILFIGNSFAVDTMEHFVNVALSLGYKKVKTWTLYHGGCSIDRHYNNIIHNIKDYSCFINEGNGIIEKPDYSIIESIQSDDWDYIAIQHGTGDGSKYANKESYNKLQELVNIVKENANLNAKIVFNMTWVGESDFKYGELITYEGNQIKLYQDIAKLTKEYIRKIQGIDYISPTGTAIQNARLYDIGKLTRDGYHLSLDTGRYIASLTLLKTITNINIDNISWAPEGVSDKAKEVSIKAVNDAINNPFKVTI